MVKLEGLPDKRMQSKQVYFSPDGSGAKLIKYDADRRNNRRRPLNPHRSNTTPWCLLISYCLLALYFVTARINQKPFTLQPIKGHTDICLTPS